MTQAGALFNLLTLAVGRSEQKCAVQIKQNLNLVRVEMIYNMRVIFNGVVQV